MSRGHKVRIVSKFKRSLLEGLFCPIRLVGGKGNVIRWGGKSKTVVAAQRATSFDWRLGKSKGSHD